MANSTPVKTATFWADQCWQHPKSHYQVHSSIFKCEIDSCLPNWLNDVGIEINTNFKTAVSWRCLAQWWSFVPCWKGRRINFMQSQIARDFTRSFQSYGSRNIVLPPSTRCRDTTLLKKDQSQHSKSVRNESGMVDLVGIHASLVFIAQLLHRHIQFSTRISFRS